MMTLTPLFLESIGTGELLLIILIVFLFFGPEKMPEIAQKIGKVMNDMKKASSDITQEFSKHTQPIRDEFLAASNEIQKQTEDIKQELDNTYTNSLESPVTDTPAVTESHQEINTTKATKKRKKPGIPKDDLAG